MARKDDRFYAESLLKEVDKLLGFSSRVDFSDPERNEEAIYAMNFCIVRMREIMVFLSDDFRSNRLGIRSGQFADFRNLLVHEYGHTDYSAYEDLVHNDMIRLRDNLRRYLGFDKKG